MTDIEKHNFICDVSTTLVETGDWGWFQFKGYRWHRPDLSGGTAEPVVIDGRTCGNVEGQMRLNDTESGEHGQWRGISDVVALGIERLLAGPVEGLHESYRGQVVAAWYTNETGDIDADLADIIAQVGYFNEVIYA